MGLMSLEVEHLCQMLGSSQQVRAVVSRPCLWTTYGICLAIVGKRMLDLGDGSDLPWIPVILNLHREGSRGKGKRAHESW